MMLDLVWTESVQGKATFSCRTAYRHRPFLPDFDFYFPRIFIIFYLFPDIATRIKEQQQEAADN